MKRRAADSRKEIQMLIMVLLFFKWTLWRGKI